MRIVSADTGGALLDGNYTPIGLIATSAVLVERPYRSASLSIVRFSDPFNYDMWGRQAIRDEVLLALKLAKKVKPDIVHIDSTLGGIELRKLDDPTIDALRISDRGKAIWHELARELQPIAKRFWEETGIEVVAIGKESVPVRIAEIYAGLYSVKWGIEFARENGSVRIGLPRYLSVEFEGGRLVGRSLDPREGGLHGAIPANVESVEWGVYPNPVARTFMVFEAWR